MKLLLTSNGLSNDSIANAFRELIDVEPSLSKIAFIPTAANMERGNKDWLIDDLYRIKSRGYGVDIIELTALQKEDLKKILDESDAVFVGGGSTFYLSYWMQKSGLFDLLPEFMETKLYAGISAGSMITGRSLLPSDALDNIQEFLDDHYFDGSAKDGSFKGQASDKTLDFADLVFRPHLNSEFFPKVRKEVLEQVVPKLKWPLYALDDESALKIVDGQIDVISEGEWLRLEKPA